MWNRPFTREVDDFGDHLQRTFLFFSRKMMTRTPEIGDRSLRMSMFSLLWLDFLLVLWEGSLSLWHPRGEQDSTLSKNVTLGVVQYWVYIHVTRSGVRLKPKSNVWSISPWHPLAMSNPTLQEFSGETWIPLDLSKKSQETCLFGVHFMVEPLVIIHFHRIFHYKPSSYWGTPMTLETPKFGDIKPMGFWALQHPARILMWNCQQCRTWFHGTSQAGHKLLKSGSLEVLEDMNQQSISNQSAINQQSISNQSAINQQSISNQPCVISLLPVFIVDCLIFIPQEIMRSTSNGWVPPAAEWQTLALPWHVRGNGVRLILLRSSKSWISIRQS